MVESRNFIKSNKGQGTIEYILLLVITISMILLALGQIFRPLGTFMQDYMGTYVACMLSSGELPGLKSEDKLSDANPTCAVKFNGGKGSASGNGNANNGQNGNANNGQNGSSANNSNTSNKNGKNGNRGSNGNDSSSSDSSGSSGGGSNTYAGSGSRKSMFGRSRSGSSDSGDADAGGKKTYVNALNGKGDRFFRQRNQQQTFNASNGRGLAISGFTEDMRKKQERKVQSEPRTLPKSDTEEFSRSEKKSIVKPPPETKKNSELKTEEMTFGGYFKYIFIVVIILLIVILGGGQMFEMSKSYD